jgi:hypothetical protein
MYFIKVAKLGSIYFLSLYISYTTCLYANDNSNLTIDPFNTVSINLVHLATTYPSNSYTFPNMDGKIANRGLNYFLSVHGSGNYHTLFNAEYEIQSSTVGGLRFKKGSLFLKTSSISLEFGRNNIWLGNGYYGSLLLSNNAEPYTLVRFRTERDIRIPYIGSFGYTIFHGWPRRFSLLGHQLCWRPASWLELNLKQTIVYTGAYNLMDYLEMFTGKEANIGGKLGRTDSRASIELVFSLGLIKNRFPKIKNATFFIEYGGEDLYAKWQVPDSFLDKELWVGPFGFQFLDTGLQTGIVIESQSDRTIIEYAQNYKSHYLFYDPYNGGRPYNVSWYRHTSQPAFQNYGNIMGHHMGSAAQLLSFHYTRSFGRISASVMFSRRHRWHIVLEEFNRSYKSGLAERQDALGGMIKFKLKTLEFSFNLQYNFYKNTDSELNPLVNRPVSGERAEEIISGFEVRLII